jgi:hypothetical protein
MAGALLTSQKIRPNKGVTLLALMVFLLLSCRLPARAGGWFRPTFTDTLHGPQPTATATVTPRRRQRHRDDYSYPTKHLR